MDAAKVQDKISVIIPVYGRNEYVMIWRNG